MVRSLLENKNVDAKEFTKMKEKWKRLPKSDSSAMEFCPLPSLSYKEVLAFPYI